MEWGKPSKAIQLEKPLTESLPNPLKKRERARDIYSLLVFMIPTRMYHGVISIRLFTCKFKYMHTCTDKTLPRVFLTDALLTCISVLFTSLIRFPSYRWSALIMFTYYTALVLRDDEVIKFSLRLYNVEENIFVSSKIRYVWFLHNMTHTHTHMIDTNIHI